MLLNAVAFLSNNNGFNKPPIPVTNIPFYFKGVPGYPSSYVVLSTRIQSTGHSVELVTVIKLGRYCTTYQLKLVLELE